MAGLRRGETRKGRGFGALLAALVAVAAVTLTPASALAGTVNLSTGNPGAIRYDGALNETNVVTVSATATTVTITDTATIAIGIDMPPCMLSNANQTATCTGTGLVAFLGNQNDQLTFSSTPAGVAQVSGGDGGDTLTGGPGREVMQGDAGIDTLSGNGGNDALTGGGENDTMTGGEGNDLFEGLPALGGAPGNWVAGDDDADGGEGNDTFLSTFGDPGSDTFAGGGGDDLYQSIAPDGNDIFSGGPGNDTYQSPRLDGSDVVTGGTGRDTVDCSSRTGVLTVTLDGAPGDGQAGEGDNIGADVEDFLSGSANDTIAGNGLGNALKGAAGDDVLSGAGGNDALDGGLSDAGSDTLDGGDGDDSGTGGPGDDALLGRGGADSLDGGGGADSLSGHDGPDQLFGGAGIDALSGGSGDDLVRGGAPALVGADGSDSLKGDEGNDRLLGDEGDDTLDGGTGADSMSGGDGTDTADFQSRFESIATTLDALPNDGAPGERDNVGTDVENVRGGRLDDDIEGDARSNVLEGRAGEDYADGGRGPDDLDGGVSGDVLRARDGGADRIACGDGPDFVIADSRDSAGADCERVDRAGRARPVQGRTTTIRRRKGKPDFSPARIRRFVPLKDVLNVPVSSRVDARRAEVALTTARGRRRQSATFGSGIFQVRQGRRGPGLTEVVMKGGSFSRCRPARGARGDASAAQRSRRVIRRLRGRARGRFRTRGRYSAATVRGTNYEVIDRCDGTLTRVTSGVVVVRDLARRRTIRLRAGKSYLARAR